MAQRHYMPCLFHPEVQSGRGCRFCASCGARLPFLPCTGRPPPTTETCNPDCWWLYFFSSTSSTGLKNGKFRGNLKFIFFFSPLTILWYDVPTLNMRQKIRYIIYKTRWIPWHLTQCGRAFLTVLWIRAELRGSPGIRHYRESLINSDSSFRFFDFTFSTFK